MALKEKEQRGDPENGTAADGLLPGGVGVEADKECGNQPVDGPDPMSFSTALPLDEPSV